jgi:hypothetical protein
MTKQTAAVLKGSDPRPQLPLTVQWNVAAGNLSTWTKLQFTLEKSGLLTGTVTLNNQTIAISEGYISKNNKVKFSFTDANGNYYLAKGLYVPGSGSTAARISGSLLVPPIKAATGKPGIGDTDDGTWSATAQGGGADPDN